MNVRSEINKNFKFKLVHKDKHCGARAGIISTPHGDIETPVFMPVGTHGAIKALQPKELKDLDIQIEDLQMSLKGFNKDRASVMKHISKALDDYESDLKEIELSSYKTPEQIFAK